MGEPPLAAHRLRDERDLADRVGAGVGAALHAHVDVDAPDAVGRLAARRAAAAVGVRVLPALERRAPQREGPGEVAVAVRLDRVVARRAVELVEHALHPAGRAGKGNG